MTFRTDIRVIPTWITSATIYYHVPSLYMPSVCHSHPRSQSVSVKKLSSLVAKQEKALAKIDAALSAALEVHGQIALTLALTPIPSEPADCRPRKKAAKPSPDCD